MADIRSLLAAAVGAEHVPRVLGIDAVLASGEVFRSGGRLVKISSGYDLTQPVVGSEGSLALGILGPGPVREDS